MIRAFSQTTVELSGTSDTTIAPAPIFTLFPIRILPIIVAPAPINTLFPIIGLPPLPPPYRNPLKDKAIRTDSSASIDYGSKAMH